MKTFSSSEIFTAFVDYYVNGNKLSSMQVGVNDIAARVADGSSKFSDQTGFEGMSDIWGNASSKCTYDETPQVAAAIDFTTACNAIYDSQIRLLNILGNINFSMKLAVSADSYNLVFNLLRFAGVSSSFDVCSQAPDQFVQANAQYFGMDAKLSAPEQQSMASDYCRSAANTNSQIILTYYNILDAQATSKRGAAWSSYADAADANYADVPSYQSLFDEQLKLDVPEFQSVISPAAYLVDLVKNQDKYIGLADGSDPDNSAHLLLNRRPDLAGLILNEENTDTDIPKLSIGVELLSQQLYGQWQSVDPAAVTLDDKTIGEIQAKLSADVYPLSMPFDYKLEKSRAALTGMGSSVAEVWQALYPVDKLDPDYNPDEPDQDSDGTTIPAAADPYVQWGEQLGIAKVQLDFLRASESSNDYVKVVYGITDKSPNQDMWQVEQFKAQTGLSGTQLADVLYGDLDKAEINSSTIFNLYHNAQPQDSDDLQALEIDAATGKFTNASVEKMVRLNRFIRLAEITAYSYADLHWILYTENDYEAGTHTQDSIAHDFTYRLLTKLHTLMVQYELSSVKDALALIGLLKDYGTAFGDTQIVNAFGSLAPVDAVCLAWRPADGADASTALLAGALGLSIDDLIKVAKLACAQFSGSVYDNLDAGTDYDMATTVTLDQEFLSALYRMAANARLWKIGVDDLLYAVTNLGCQALAAPIYTNSFGATINAVNTIKDFLDRLSAAGLTLAEARFSSNDASQDSSMAPGDSDTALLINDIQSGINGVLLTDSEFDTWLQTVAIAGEDLSNISLENLQEADVVDQFGVILSDEVGTAWKKASQSMIDAGNAMLAEYADKQGSLMDNVLAPTLAVDSRIVSTLSSWGKLVADTSSSEVGINNLLHVFYSMVQDATDRVLQTNYLGSLARFAAMVNGLCLDKATVDFLISGNATRVQPMQGDFSLNPSAIEQIISLSALQKVYRDSDNNLLTFLAERNMGALVAATQWNDASIEQLLDAWGLDVSTYLDSIALTTALQTCFQLSGKTRLSVEQLQSVCVYVSGGNGSFSQALASELENAFYAVNAGQDLVTLKHALYDNLNARYCTVLADELLYAYSQSGNSVLQGVTTRDALSEYLLFDVEVSGACMTSRVKEITGAVQAFCYRTMMQLEPGLRILDPAFSNDYWPWMKNYRVWEANCEVFLYPENYLDPSLYTEASHCFDSFKNTLQANDVAEATVSAAYSSYLNDFSTVARVKVTNSHLTAVDENNQCRLMLVGHVPGMPDKYYYREGRFFVDADTGRYTPVAWTAWADVGATISSNYPKSVYANNRLYLFWIQFKPAGTTDDIQKLNIYEATIYYSYQQVDGNWCTAISLPSVSLMNLGSAEDCMDSFLLNNLDLALDSDSNIAVSYHYRAQAGTILLVTRSYTIDALDTATAVPDFNASYGGIGAAGGQLDTLTAAEGSPFKMYTEYSPDLALSTLYSVEHQALHSEPAYYYPANYEADFQCRLMLNQVQMDTSALAPVTTGMWFYLQDDDTSAKDKRVLALTNLDDVNVNDQTPGLHCYLNISNKKLKLRFMGSDQADPHTPVGSMVQLFNLYSDEIKAGQWLYIAMGVQGNGVAGGNGGMGFDWVIHLCTVDNGYLKAAISQSGVQNNDIAMYNTPTFSHWINSWDIRATYMQHWYTVGLMLSTDAATSKQQIEQLAGLSFAESRLLPFGDTSLISQSIDGAPNNQDFYILDAGNAEYLATPLSNTAQGDNLRFTRLTSGQVAADFERAFLTGGIDSLLNTGTQLDAEASFSALQPDVEKVPRHLWPADGRLDISGANGQYYQEMFHMAPWLVARQYFQSGVYDSAQQWYRYVFDPAQLRDSVTAVEDTQLQQDTGRSDLYWRYIGLRSFNNALVNQGANPHGPSAMVGNTMDNQLDWEESATGSTFADSMPNQAIQRFYSDPFEPFALAALRPSVYQKAMVKDYVQNIIDWADSLYEEESRESLQEAWLLYQEAEDLLGSAAQAEGTFSESENVSVAALTSLYGQPAQYPQFLLGLETDLSKINQSVVVPATNKVSVFNDIPGLYFGVPENDQLQSQRQVINNRLSNLRQNLDMDGNPMDLALYQPPIDPMQLIRAAANGELTDTLSGSQQQSPSIYRFEVLAGQAASYTQSVRGYSQMLESALERQDGETLAQLQLTQQAKILQMTQSVREEQIKLANNGLEQLQTAALSALLRYTYYSALNKASIPASSKESFTLGAGTDYLQELKSKLGTGKAKSGQELEIAGLSMSIISQVLMSVATVAYSASGAASIIPQISLATGQDNFTTVALPSTWKVLAQQGGAINNAAWTANMLGGIFNQQSGIKYRQQDWSVQKKLVEDELTRIDQQYTAAISQLKNVQQDYEINKQQIENNQTIIDFYHNKFSNQELYGWMAGQLSSTLNQAYKLALKYARQAQFALEFERGWEIGSVNIVNTHAWNAKYKGLLSGELLAQSLNQLSAYALETDHRRFEITKTVSLNRKLEEDTANGSLQTQLENGNTVTFGLTEDDFDIDYPGQYRRLIKTVTVSIPAVLPAYQNMHVILKQLSNSVVISADPNVAPRVNFAPDQEVALSSGVNETGLFSGAGEDARYLPFENTGAASTWQLTLNENDNLKINDIIFTIHYSACK